MAGWQVGTLAVAPRPTSAETTRINCKVIGQAAASQCTNVAIAMALAEGILRGRGIEVRNVVASNAVDPCVFADLDWAPEGGRAIGSAATDASFVAVASTNQLVYNSNPTKLGCESIRSAARKLAHMELEREAISERMASSNYMLTALCRSVSGGYDIDVRAVVRACVRACARNRARARVPSTGRLGRHRSDRLPLL